MTLPRSNTNMRIGTGRPLSSSSCLCVRLHCPLGDVKWVNFRKALKWDTKEKRLTAYNKGPVRILKLPSYLTERIEYRLL